MNMRLNDYDAILCVIPEESSINEVDSRMIGTKSSDATLKGLPGWRPGSSKIGSHTFGSSMQSDLSGLGKGYWTEVTDFDRYVVVNVGYHNTITGKSASKCFLVVFDNGSNGMVMSTMAKWRSISGYSQAASYIRSCASSLPGLTN